MQILLLKRTLTTIFLLFCILEIFSCGLQSKERVRKRQLNTWNARIEEYEKNHANDTLVNKRDTLEYKKAP